MGNSLEEYRFRIGSYLPSCRVKVQNSSILRNYSRPSLFPRDYRLILVIVVFYLTNSWYKNTLAVSAGETISKSVPRSDISYSIVHLQGSFYIELSNFFARYLYGNRQTKGIKIIHYNKGNGFLANKKHEIECIISRFHPHILGVSEANFMKDQNKCDVDISDYNLLTCPTLDNPELSYSRIVVYVHNSLVFKVRTDLMCDKYSSIWLQVGMPNQRQFLVCQTYREWQYLRQHNNSSKSIESQFSRWMMFLDQWERALNTGLEVLVIGDININHLDWSCPLGMQSSQTVKLRPLINELFQRIFPHSVTQCVTVPTRFMSHQTPTGLDHLYTNRPDKLTKVETQFCGGSDHKLVFAIRKSKSIIKQSRYIHKRCYKSFDLDAFMYDLENIKWWEVYKCDYVEQAVEHFTNTFVALLDKHIPLRVIQIRKNYVPWLSDQTKQLMEERDLAHRLVASSSRQDDWLTYKKLRNKVTARLKSEENSWQKSKLSHLSGNPAEQWSNVLGWLGWKNSCSPTQLFYEGKLYNRPLDIANCQNHYFIDKVKKLLQDMPAPTSDPLAKLKMIMKNQSSVFELKAAHPDEVAKIVLQLRNSKSTGLDTIDSEVLKLALPYILPAITHIINLSISSAQFPSQWKIAKVIPLFKKDDPVNPKNYRPVAMLPIISKVLERIVFNQITDYMETNCLMHPNHHGFRSGHSTVTCLIQMYDKWVEAIEQNDYTGVCFLDLSAAFDMVDHSLLVQKLSLYGFDIKSLNWMTSYLQNRKQTVCIEGKLSDVLDLTTGVPQGSILGPLLYVIFTNELPEILHNHDSSPNSIQSSCNSCGSLCCYADDSSFSFSGQNINIIEEQLTLKYQDISEFMCNNRLKLNGDKTHLMLLASEKSWKAKLNEDSLSILTEPDADRIKTTRSESILGCTVSQNLKWTEHILLNDKSLVKQLTSRLNALKLISRVANFKTRLMLTNGLFMSKLVYCISLWGGCEDFLIRSLQIVQNKAARLVCRKGIYTPVKTLLCECNWLSVAQLAFYHGVILLYKVRQCKKPRYLFDMFTTSRRYNTRGENLGKLASSSEISPVHGLNLKSFRWRSIQAWNSLPTRIRDMTNIEVFKKHLKEWVQENLDV